jgi:GntR family transcriptional regulator
VVQTEAVSLGRPPLPVTAGSGGPGPQGLDRAGGLPLWAQLLADLRRRLTAGEFAAAFPGELALVAEYGVSRHTVREALRRLREEGLVVAGRGRPPRLAGPAEIAQPLGTPYSLFSAVEATGRVQRSVVRVLDVRADGVVAARMGLEESTPLVHLERLRLADEEPLAIDRVWLPERLAAPLLEVDFSRTALYDEYATRCGVRVVGGHEHIRAVVPGPAERELLGTGPDVAAFAIDRLGLAGGRPAEWRHTLVRGDRFSVTARFSAAEGYRVGDGER